MSSSLFAFGGCNFWLLWQDRASLIHDAYVIKMSFWLVKLEIVGCGVCHKYNMVVLPNSLTSVDFVLWLL